VCGVKELQEDDWAEDPTDHDWCENDGDKRGQHFVEHGSAIKDDGVSVAWMGLNFPKEEFKECSRKDECGGDAKKARAFAVFESCA